MQKYKFLDKVNTPADVKKLNNEQLIQLCTEIRVLLVDSISKTGGHLASNLGVVELTVAMHKVFDSPQDQFVWDVGHQSYTHKILTGRKDRFQTLRQENGISGFPKHSESIHDAFIAGHASTSVSAAHGIVKANSLQNKNNHVLAVIGDGSFTGGMVYEALNNAGRTDENLIVILNHNNMSISKNVGAFARYLTGLRTDPGYLKAKSNVEKALDNASVVGKAIKQQISSSKKFVKKMIYHSNFFEDLGFAYFGPVDGHDIPLLVNTLRRAKKINKPVFIQVDTIKGKGYSHAEMNPGAYHGISTFNKITGDPDVSDEDSYSAVFGKKLTELAQLDKKICAITAAMKYGTGLQYFKAKFRKRFFDVGIAEEHAVTFASGLASNGMVPVFAVYSTFLQRAYDQIIHDAAIEQQHIILAVDRAGFVGNDGETHQGLFDAAFLGTIPHTTVYSPSNYLELSAFLERALYRTPAVAVIRYPKGREEPNYTFKELDADFQHMEKRRRRILLVTYGRLFTNVYAAKEQLEQSGIKVSILKLNRISPLPKEAVQAAKGYKQVYFFEEGIRRGGVAENFLVQLYQEGFRGQYKIHAVGDEFVPQATVESSMRHYGLDIESIVNTITNDGE